MTLENRMRDTIVGAAALAGLLLAAAPAHAAGGATAKIKHKTLTVTGTAKADKLALSLKPGKPNKLQVDFGDDGKIDKTFNRTKFKKLVINEGAGDDAVRIDEANGDVGAATVDGQGGRDVLTVAGTNAADKLDAAANGRRVRLTENGVRLDLNGLEELDAVTRAGADQLAVHSLAGTGVTAVGGDLGTADGAADLVSLDGTNAADNIGLTGGAGAVSVTGLPAAVRLTHADTLDRVTLQALGGNDIAGSALDGTGPGLTVDAGAGDDQVTGGLGNDLIVGGDGDDLITGGRGNDVALMGAGDDTFVWNPGDGNDTLEGQDGADTMQFNGANVNEREDVSANGQRVRFTRDVANIVMDLNGIERIDNHTAGGVDSVTVHDLSGTAVTQVANDLGANDGAADTVAVEGTQGDDAITVAGASGEATISGLPATVSLTGGEAANDRIRVSALAGDDVVQGSDLQASAPPLTADGGDGADVLIGGAGADTLLGGAGDDVLIGGPGQDVLDGGTGDNIVIQD